LKECLVLGYRRIWTEFSSCWLWRHTCGEWHPWCESKTCHNPRTNWILGLFDFLQTTPPPLFVTIVNLAFPFQINCAVSIFDAAFEHRQTFILSSGTLWKLSVSSIGEIANKEQI
jgi:hypothetical protein